MALGCKLYDRSKRRRKFFILQPYRYKIYEAISLFWKNSGRTDTIEYTTFCQPQTPEILVRYNQSLGEHRTMFLITGVHNRIYKIFFCSSPPTYKTRKFSRALCLPNIQSKVFVSISDLIFDPRLIGALVNVMKILLR